MKFISVCMIGNDHLEFSNVCQAPPPKIAGDCLSYMVGAERYVRLSTFQVTLGLVKLLKLKLNHRDCSFFFRKKSGFMLHSLIMMI